MTIQLETMLENASARHPIVQPTTSTMHWTLIVASFLVGVFVLALCIGAVLPGELHGTVRFVVKGQATPTVFDVSCRARCRNLGLASHAGAHSDTTRSCAACDRLSTVSTDGPKFPKTGGCAFRGGERVAG